MRLSVLAAATLGLGVAGCQSARSESAGPDMARQFQVGSFDKVEVSGPFAVEVVTGRQAQVAARGPSNIVEKMVVEVDGSTLQIHPEERKGWFGDWHSINHNGTARVTVAVPMLTGAAIAGAGEVAVDRIATDSFKGEIAGSGAMKLPQLQARLVELEIAGSGSINAAGRAPEARYEITGAGEIRADRLATDNSRIEIMGAGDVSANARSTAKVDIAGAGNVRVTGGAKCSIDKAGAGEVHCS